VWVDSGRAPRKTFEKQDQRLHLVSVESHIFWSSLDEMIRCESQPCEGAKGVLLIKEEIAISPTRFAALDVTMRTTVSHRDPSIRAVLSWHASLVDKSLLHVRAFVFARVNPTVLLISKTMYFIQTHRSLHFVRYQRSSSADLWLTGQRDRM
jgi:hypothetical protein